MRLPIRHSLVMSQSQPIEEMVRQVVDRSLPLTRRRLCRDAGTMSAGELRGYVRARAFLAVRDQARRMAAAHCLANSLAEQLAERSLERTVNLLFRELTDQPPLVLPMPEAPLRAAA